MSWPRGRYNGQRIGGWRCDVEVNIWHWGWCRPTRYGGALWLGPVRIWVRASYE